MPEKSRECRRKQHLHFCSAEGLSSSLHKDQPQEPFFADTQTRKGQNLPGRWLQPRELKVPGKGLCSQRPSPEFCSVSLSVVLGLQGGGLPGHQPSRNTNKASPSVLCAQGGETPRTLEQDTWLQLGCESRPPAFLGQDSPNGACPELPGGLLT